MPQPNTTEDTRHYYSPSSVLVILCATLALYNAFELLGLILLTFKRRQGFYFWSISLATFGVIPYCVGRILDYFGLTSTWIALAIEAVGWVLLVTGQSVVLYSRLHLVLNDPTILRGVLCMIIFNGVVWHISITIVHYGSIYAPNTSKGGFQNAYNIMERVQMTCFCLQELIISGLYIWKTVDILRTSLGSKRRFMWHLCWINILIVGMDIALLALEYKGHFVWQQGVKVVIYSVKLKLEFAVLGELVKFVQHRGNSNSGSLTNLNTEEFVDPSRSQTHRVNRRGPPTTKPGALHVEDGGKPNAVVTKTSVATMHQQGENDYDEIRVTTRIDVESYALDLRDDRSTDQLYENACRQMSRPN
ncbi:hypothetical protein QQX98_011589 [Neonectria punicea]|uniref:DUF7703 domain-containing protein n=1 Tax=Neonectria punicea TaxID=979145 RepID=A0ABR1GL82_9HYPO